MASDRPRSRIRFRVWITLAATVFICVAGGLLLTYLLRDVDWAVVGQAGLAALIPITLLTIMETVCYVLLVYVLIRGSGHQTTVWKAYLVLTTSLTANYVTPVNVAIPLRVYLYRSMMGIPATQGMALVTVEALVGILVPALISVAGIALLFPDLGLIAPIVLILCLTGGTVLMLLLPFGRLMPRLKHLPLAPLLARLANYASQFQLGLHQLSPLTIMAVISLDLLMLLVQGWRLWLVLKVFSTPPSLLTTSIILSMSITAGYISLIPLGLGVRDASLTLLLLRVGIPQEVALSAAVIQRLFAPGWPLLLGLISTSILGVQALADQNHREDESNSET